jgi:NTP pyrophosphatase (non-canonical NTP hydrolase)
MMTRTEHLLTILAEECNEVAQRASKALRFGLDEVQPGQALDNYTRIWKEMADLAAVGAMLVDEVGRGGVELEDLVAKRAKVERFLDYSHQCGTLQPSNS